jgi:hypothetical protein
VRASCSTSHPTGPSSSPQNAGSILPRRSSLPTQLVSRDQPKGTVSRGFFCFRFFCHKSSSPKPLKITLGSIRFFSKIGGDIRKSRCTTGIPNFRKIRNCPNGILRGSGEMIHEKNLKLKISWHSHFKAYSEKCSRSHQIAEILLTHFSAAEEKVWFRGNFGIFTAFYHKM